MFPLSGLIGICPEVKTSPPEIIAWEYGPMAAGALFVDILLAIL
jgi:hypothetical protein